MMNFIEWCKDKGLSLEMCHKDPVRAGKKMKGEKGDSGKYSGNVRKMYKDLSQDYKGNWETNGTVDPFEVKGKGHGKAAGDVAK